MKTRSFQPVLVISLACAVWLTASTLFTVSAVGDEPKKEPAEAQFVRVGKSPSGDPLALETAITTYTSNDEPSVTVDLIGAVHIADKAYYTELNRLFESYDAVLYELVAYENEKPRPGERSANPVSALQVGMKNLLGLEFQLDCIDYTKKNLRHADLTPDEFAKSMRDRGESISQMFLRMLGQSIAQQSKDPAGSSDARLLLAFFSKDRALQLKRIMAEQLGDVTDAASALEGPDGSTIVTERNKRALQELKSAMQDGHKRIAIFYGAAHMPDIEKRLCADFGLSRSKERWLTAWSLEAKPAPPTRGADQ